MTTDQRVAILTHASAPLGASLARGLMQAGYTVALLDEDIIAVEKLAAELNHAELAARPYSSGGSEHSVRKIMESIVAHLGEPRVLVTCPLSAPGQSAMALNGAELKDILEQSVIRAFLWSKALGERITHQRPAVVVHVTELSGLGGWPGWLAQSIAYAAIHNLVHTLAAEWASSGIRVNALVAGITADMAEHIAHSVSDRHADEVRRRVPAAAYMQPEDLIAALQYLIDPDASYVSGEILRVDGGWDIWGRLSATTGEDER